MKQIIQEIPIKEVYTAKKKQEKKESSKFLDKLKEHLISKNISLTKIILEKKKELLGIISLDTQFGKQEFYLIAKDKRKIIEEDLMIALQKAHSEKLPAVLISPGEIDKKALEYYTLWSNLIRFEKLI